MRPTPPAYAWDWFARQRLLWREVRRRLAEVEGELGARYAGVEIRRDVMSRLRKDFVRDERVRGVVEAVVSELSFLSQTDRSFAELGARNAPRGLRWWWSAITGEVLDVPQSRATKSPAPSTASQLSLDDVFEGYGG